MEIMECRGFLNPLAEGCKYLITLSEWDEFEVFPNYFAMPKAVQTCPLSSLPEWLFVPLLLLAAAAA
ncbi:hypothetical protein H9L39_17620 [Fusarium oxysporum f. sp. albedinis]|nr:hypothetical protein H9L39_17620 [Fusarium oxysporum f. sp. albedinis]